MVNFYLSDTHFCHEKIISLCNRPFDNAEQMNEVMVANWNRVIRHDEDDVYFLGDFAWDEHEKWFGRLAGRKHIVWGNHDQKATKLAWTSTHDYLELVDGPFKLKLFHYPIVEWNGFFKGHYHFYGHVHTNEMKDQSMAWKAKSKNVGVEWLDYTPKTAHQIINKGKNDDNR